MSFSFSRQSRKVLDRLRKRRSDSSGFYGDFPDWVAAREQSRGYESKAIFDKVLSAARAVRDGKALWERDGVTFDVPCANWPVLTCLLRAAALRSGKLHVIDFGGALGSLWWQHRSWLEGIDLTWTIIEQPEFVDVGRQEFCVGPLEFRSEWSPSPEEPEPYTVLLSSVLPYLEKPVELLRSSMVNRSDFVIIDRTGFVCDRSDRRLTVQRVPPSIYEASYPCWFFALEEIESPLRESHRLVESWVNDDYVNIDAEFRGMFWERRSGA